MQSPLPPVLPIRPFTRPAKAVVSVPGSKSITNRALALAALCNRKVEIKNALVSRDTEIMQRALCALGRNVEFLDTDSTFVVNESENGIFPVKIATINVGNAGTAARFLTAILCLVKDGEFTIDGDEAMYRRPMKGLTDALSSLGAEFTFHKTDGCIPFTVKTHGIKGDVVQVDASESSQILSALLIMAAGVGRPFAVEMLTETVSEPFVLMTVQMMEQFNVNCQITKNWKYFTVCGENVSEPLIYQVEPDATAASYFFILPIVAPPTTSSATDGIIVNNIRYVESQTTHPPILQGDLFFENALSRVGLSFIELTSFNVLICNLFGEGNLLQGINSNFNLFSDTFLTLAAVSPLLSGVTRIEGIGHTRKQETDRVHAAFVELHDKLGQDVIEEPDALEIHPNLDAMKKLAQEARARQAATGEGTGCIEIDTYRDHRFAMSFAILGCRDLLGDGKPWLAIKNPACCKKTFPNFFDVLEDAWNQSHK
jgi:3-phosphoshikimate 1-carboxyvinyltransferase